MPVTGTPRAVLTHLPTHAADNATLLHTDIGWVGLQLRWYDCRMSCPFPVWDDADYRT